MAGEKNSLECGDEGCYPVRQLTSALQEFNMTSKNLTSCVNLLNTNVGIQNQKLEEGNRRFSSLEKRMLEVEHVLDGDGGKPGLKTRLAVLNDRSGPSRGQSAAVGAGAGGGMFLLAKLAAWLMGNGN